MMQEINPDFGFQSVRHGERDRAELKQQAAGDRTECGAQEVLAGVREPDRLRHHVSAVDAGVAVGDSGPPDFRSAEPRQHAAGPALLHDIEVPFETRQWLLQKGTSAEYGARELNRTIHRKLTQPLATMVATGQINPGATVRVDVEPAEERSWCCATGAAIDGQAPRCRPCCWWMTIATCCTFWSG